MNRLKVIFPWIIQKLLWIIRKLFTGKKEEAPKIKSQGHDLNNVYAGRDINMPFYLIPQDTPKRKIILSTFEKDIFLILAEGGKARYALREDGRICQINVFGHPAMDTVAPNAEATLAAFRKLLRLGLIDDDPAEKLYQCSKLGKEALNAGRIES